METNIEMGEKYISLYLEIVETDSFPLCWEVNVKFILFVYDQLEDKYLAIQGNLIYLFAKNLCPRRTFALYIEILP